MKVGNIITFCLLMILLIGLAGKFVIEMIGKRRNADVVA